MPIADPPSQEKDRINAKALFPDRKWIAAFEAPRDESKHRRLVLCFDGTGNQFSENDSNVLRFFKCLRKDDDSQLVYYQSGIGTYTNLAFVTKPVIEVSMALDAAIGWNIESHVQDAYRFLMQHCTSSLAFLFVMNKSLILEMKPDKPGDKISLFGFSRGAYTARVLLGFVQKIGLLPPEHHLQIPFAWNVFKHSDDVDSLDECAGYKKAFSLSVEFDFIGVWCVKMPQHRLELIQINYRKDTVASLGISGIELPFAKPMNDGGIRVFRHALALDERRAKCTPNFKLTESGTKAATDLDETKSSRGSYYALNNPGETYQRAGPSGAQERGEGQALLANRIREVWFAGCHCDVGGGSVHNTERNSLARIPLRWMIRECFRMKTGIEFDEDILCEVGFGAILPGPDPVVMQAERLPGSSQRLERDVPLHKSLKDSTMILLLWTPVELFLLFLYALLMYPVNLVRYSKWFKSLSRAPERTAESDLERGPNDAYGAANSEQATENYANRLLEKGLNDASGDAGSEIPDANEADEELRDALSPTYDQLSINWFWWIFEIWPIIFRLQDSKNSRQELETRVNLGKGRKIYGDAWNVFKKDEEKRWYIEVHRSVRTRMEAEDGMRYRPRAWFSVSGEADFHWEGPNFADVEDRGMIRWVE